MRSTVLVSVDKLLTQECQSWLEQGYSMRNAHPSPGVATHQSCAKTTEMPAPV